MTSILIIYHTQSGHTLELAREAAGGAAEVEGASVLLKPAREASLDDLLSCDGLLVGSPEYFGYMAGQIKDFFDRTYGPAQGRREVFRKPYAVFISAGNDGEGALRSIERIGLGYQFKKVCAPVVVKGEITPKARAACRELGQTLAAGCQAGIY